MENEIREYETADYRKAKGNINIEMTLCIQSQGNVLLLHQYFISISWPSQQQEIEEQIITKKIKRSLNN